MYPLTPISRNRCVGLAAIGLGLACSAAGPQAQAGDVGPPSPNDPRVAHGGPIEHPVDPAHPELAECITPAERAAGNAAIAAYQLLHADNGWNDRSRPTYPFIPIGATLYQDLLPPGYVDHDATAAFQDYNCTTFTYDGHAGTDLGLHYFTEQITGVPVFAALDGTVVYQHDGEPDMNTCLCGQLANALIIDHGNGRFGWYWHFKKNSVTVNVGGHVVSGQQLGFAASSGNSGGPHLHFGTSDDPGGVTFDPFAGPCGGPTSGWDSQPAMDLHTYLADFGFSTQNLSGYPGWPYRYPNTGQMGFDEFLWFWGQIVNLPAHSTWRQFYYRPDGTLAFDSGDVLFEANQTEMYRVSNWWWYSYYIPDMRTIAGKWRVRIHVNGQVMIDAPLQVKPTAEVGANGGPSAPRSLRFEPASPAGKQALFCRATMPPTLDDPDYDPVRFEYVWKRNGNEFRRVTTAGQADAIPSGSVHGGQVVSCTVTVSDGKLTAAPLTLSATWGGCPSDFDGDGFVTGDDFDAYVLAFEAGGEPADFDGDGFVTGDDFDAFVAAFEQGC